MTVTVLMRVVVHGVTAAPFTRRLSAEERPMTPVRNPERSVQDATTA
jgi:hypothetical protein